MPASAYNRLQTVGNKDRRRHRKERDMSDTFERVVKVLKEQDGLEDVEFTPEMTLEEAGLDSLATVEAVMACEDEFGIEIDPESNPKTVGEFVELVEKTLEQ